MSQKPELCFDPQNPEQAQKQENMIKKEQQPQLCFDPSSEEDFKRQQQQGKQEKQEECNIL